MSDQTGVVSSWQVGRIWSFRRLPALGLVLVLLVCRVATGDESDELLKGGVPKTVDDLKALQTQTQKSCQAAIPGTVALRLGPVQGSGVIVSPDGYVLTSSRVCGASDRPVRIILHDGTMLRGRTLGSNRSMDSGLIKITSRTPAGGWPYVEMAEAGELQRGQWVLAIGYPRGHQQGQNPPVRLGRVLSQSRTGIVTDCTFLGGDLGGPLLNLFGQVVGIHSHVGEELTSNVHIPIASYHNTWDRLTAGEQWSSGPSREGVDLGVQASSEDEGNVDGVAIASARPGSPAAVAGIQAGDLITRFDGEPVASFEGLVGLVRKKKPNDQVTVQLMRQGMPLTLKVTLGQQNY